MNPLILSGNRTSDGLESRYENKRASVAYLAIRDRGSCRRLERRPMTSIPPTEHIPARATDALIQTLPIPQDVADLLAHRIMKSTYHARGCWLRNEGYRQKNGYTYISLVRDGKKCYYLAHRVLYVHYFGAIPDGYTIDHLCERRACVNPKHLQAVTHRQNVLRSRTNPFAVNARRKRERGEVA